MGNPLFQGKLKRFLKNRIVSKTKKNASLFFGILQGVKRGCAVVGEEFVLQTLRGHAEALAKEPHELSPTRDNSVDFDIGVKLQQIFESTSVDLTVQRNISSSACYQCPRGHGGAQGQILLSSSHEFLKMYEEKPGKARSIYGYIPPTIDEMLENALNEPVVAKVSEVLEPLKVRLVTKGPAHRYWASRQAQRNMLGQLQSHPQFTLTGKPLERSDLSSLLLRERSLGVKLGLKHLFDSEPNWVSGDYAAATDGLNINYTKAVFEDYLSKLICPQTYNLRDYAVINERYEKLKEVLRSVLYEHDLVYKVNLETGLKKNPTCITQGNGQLMGSTLSFPILCAINLATYWTALEKYLGTPVRKLDDLPVLINGDDILFRADDRLYSLWQGEIDKVGFKLSLGKNYTHKNYLTVNSELYHFDPCLESFSKLGYLNAGLLTGQSKLTGRKNVRILPLWDLWNKVHEGAHNPQRAMRRFIHYNQTGIRRITCDGKYNLFLPFERGGLGFSVPEGYNFNLTNFQRRYACFMEEKYFSQPDETPTIALISKKASAKLVVYRKPDFVLVPKDDPTPDYIEKEVNLPTGFSITKLDQPFDFACFDVANPLVCQGNETLEERLNYRLPTGTVLREFKKGFQRNLYPLMGKRIMEFPYRHVVREDRMDTICH